MRSCMNTRTMHRVSYQKFDGSDGSTDGSTDDEEEYEEDSEDDTPAKQFVENGSLQDLAKMYKNGWRPRDDEVAFRIAEEVGTLRKLLCVFQLPLDRFPDCAERVGQDAKVWVQQVKEDLQGLDLVLSPKHPTPEASLLANFLLVQGDAAERLMNDIVEEMVVFTHNVGEMRELRTMGGDGLKPISAERTFPEELGAMYLIREAAREDILKRDFRFDCDRLILSFDGDSYKRNKKLAYLQDEDIATQRKAYMRFGFLPTSELYPISLQGKMRQAALIPKKAAHFAFVLPSPVLSQLDHGGFLYVDEDYNLLAINSISFQPQRTAFCFKRAERMEEETSEFLRERAFEIHKSLDDILSTGAIACAWVGSSEEVPGLHTPTGGFAYFFNDPEDNCFFEIQGAAQVVSRGSLAWFFGGETEMNVEEFSPDTPGNKIEDAIARTLNWDFMSVLRSTKPTSTPIKISRIVFPGVLHPLVLFGLAYAAKDNVLKTKAAKAIAYAGYRKARGYTISRLLAEAINTMCILWFACLCRDLENTPGGWINVIPLDRHSQHIIAFVAIVLMWIANVLVCIKMFLAYRRWHWTIYFFQRRFENIACLIMEIPLIIVMVPKGFLGAPHLHRCEENWLFPQVRPLIAALGAIIWMKVLGMLSGLEFMNLGNRIIPIRKTLGEISSFIFVMLFFLGAALTVSYAMTNQLLSSLILNTYGLAFAGNYNPLLFFAEDPENYQADSIMEFGKRDFAWVVRFFVYCFFGILIMVGLNNIFIGIMSNTYDHNQERASRLFVRQRAFVALDYALLMGSTDNASNLWFCSSAGRGDGEDAVEDDNQNSSMRSRIDALSQRLDTKLEKLDTKIEEVSISMERKFQAVMEKLSGSESPRSVGMTAMASVPSIVRSPRRLHRRLHSETELDRAPSGLGRAPSGFGRASTGLQSLRG